MFLFMDMKMERVLPRVVWPLLTLALVLGTAENVSVNGSSSPLPSPSPFISICDLLLMPPEQLHLQSPNASMLPLNVTSVGNVSFGGPQLLFYPSAESETGQGNVNSSILDLLLTCKSEVANDTAEALFLEEIRRHSLSKEDGIGTPPRAQGSPDDPRQVDDHTFLWNIFLLLGYSVILVVSLFGNILVCRIIMGTPKLRTTTNILILSLTVSDIATTIFNIPFMCARTMLRDWPLPDLFCLLLPTVQVCSVYVSTFTMAAIGIHRFRAVRVGPLMMRHRRPHITSNTSNTEDGRRRSSGTARAYSPYVMTKGKIVLWIVGIWVVSILLALPHSLFNQVVNYSPSPYQDAEGQSQPARRCRAIYPKEYESSVPLLLSLETTLTQYLLPLTITAVLYTKIALIIQRQGQLARHFCDELNRRAVEAKRKRISMLIIVVAAFAISWAPLNFYHLLIDLHQVSFDYCIFMVLHQIAVLSVCYNPFIYCWMNEAFRVRAKKYLRLIGKLCPCLPTLCHKEKDTSPVRKGRKGSGREGVMGQRGRGGSSALNTAVNTEEAYSLSGVTLINGNGTTLLTANVSLTKGTPEGVPVSETVLTKGQTVVQ